VVDEKERRAHRRKLISTAVTFKDMVGGVPLRGWLHDISRGGCFIATPSLFTFGEEIDVNLTLPYPRVVVEGKARVMWVREKNDRDMPAGMGVEFVDLKEDVLAAIDRVTSTAKLSRPKTVIGIAPPAAGSSPSYSDVKIPLPKIEPKKPEPVVDADTTETETVVEPVAETETATAPEPEPETETETVTEAVAETETESVAEPIEEPAPVPAPVPIVQPPKKMGREKWLIAGAAGVSLTGLVVLGIVYARHEKTPDVIPVIIDATPQPVTIVDATAVVVPPPVVDVVVDAAPEASAPVDAGRPRDAGADGGKKKPTKKPKPKPR
jgi:uncharacterized protein (TIGR02266 family)